MAGGEPIAIVGMGCVLPGAFDVDAFWQNALRGQSALAPLENDERYDWRSFYDASGAEDHAHTLIAARVRGYQFDWRRFRMPPADVASINPLQLMILDAGRQALDVVKRIPAETTGLFLGATGLGWQRDTGLRIRYPYLVDAVLGCPEFEGLSSARKRGVLDAVYRQLDQRLKPVSEDNVVGASASVALGRISMHYDLKGLHYSIDAGFASSLAALDVGVRALRDGTVDLAVVGGASELLTPLELIAFTKLGGLAKSAVRPFDKRAEGTLLGEGAAVFALKRLDDALCDGDRVRAVVRGVGSSSDGRGKALVAPSREGQVRALRRAYDDAGVEPVTLGMVECHATGTQLGDVTEVSALREVFADVAGHSVLLGSAKPFVGHLRGGAGAVGLLRAVLAVERGEVPKQLGFDEAAPELELQRSPFVVPTTTTALLPVGGAAERRAGVTAIGFGGNNYHAVVEAFDAGAAHGKKSARRAVRRDVPIAVVGLGGRFPGASDVPSFWRSLLDEKDSTGEVPKERWDIARHYDPDPTRLDTSYTKLGCFLDEVPGPSPEWRIPPSALPVIDPSQLLVLHAAEEAMRDAGFDPERWDRERTAIMLAFLPYQGKKFLADVRVNFAEYRAALARALDEHGLEPALQRRVLDDVERRFKQELPPITEDSLAGWLGNICAARIAHRFDLHGPSFVVDSACASSLTALHAAVTALRHGTCDAALSGGVWCDMMPEFFIAACRFNALSSTGSTPFDAAADGFIPGEGAGIFVLRRLEDAERDGQRIHAVLRAVCGSSDGKGRSVLAPTVEGEALAMSRALIDAGVAAGDVGYIECHGTGTALGDVVEVEATRLAYRGPRRAPLLIGSVKSNIGHLNAAAGAAALMKAVLAVREGVIPASLKVVRPNPNIAFGDGDDEGPVTRVCTTTRPFERAGDAPRRAGVSGFGVGGSNMHLIVEEHRAAPPAETRKRRPSTTVKVDEPLPILAVSADDLEGCAARLYELMRDVAAGDEARFTRALAESQEEEHGRFRIAVVAPSSDRFLRRALLVDGALAKKRPLALLASQGVLASSPELEGGVAALFPGQGPQYANMMREAAARFSPLAEDLDVVDEAYRRLAGRTLRSAFFTDDSGGWVQRDEDIHCAVFAVNVALYSFFRRHGLTPDVLIGQSAGELSALVAAGALSLEDGLTAVRERTLAVLALDVADPGRMLAMSCSAEAAAPLLEGLPAYAAIAADNCPSACIVSALAPAVVELTARAAAAGVDVEVLPVSHGYHSEIIASARGPYRRVLEGMRARAPEVPIISTITGASMQGMAAAALPAHLASQFVEPVRLQAAVKAAYASGVRFFLECGPKWPLTTFIGQILQGRPHAAHASLHPKTGEVEQLCRALAFAFVNHKAALHTVEVKPLGAEAALSSASTRALEEAERAIAGVADVAERRALLLALRERIDGLLAEGPRAAAPIAAAVVDVAAPVASPAPAIVEPRAVPAIARPSSAGRAREVQAMLVERLVLRTGYPADMLEPGLDLEGDLGIDTVKQVAVIGEVRAALGLEPDAGFRLRDANTIERAAAYLVGRLERQGAPAARAAAAAAAPARVEEARPAPAPAPVVVEPKAPAPRGKDDRFDEVRAMLVAQLVERTGYPADMLDLDLDLEGELGIDTVKQVAVIGEVRRRLGLAQDPTFRLRDANTLRKATVYLVSRAQAPVTPTEAAHVDEPVGAVTANGATETTTVAAETTTVAAATTTVTAETTTAPAAKTTAPAATTTVAAAKPTVAAATTTVAAATTTVAAAKPRAAAATTTASKTEKTEADVARPLASPIEASALLRRIVEEAERQAGGGVLAAVEDVSYARVRLPAQRAQRPGPLVVEAHAAGTAGARRVVCRVVDGAAMLASGTVVFASAPPPVPLDGATAALVTDVVTRGEEQDPAPLLEIVRRVSDPGWRALFAAGAHAVCGHLEVGPPRSSPEALARLVDAAFTCASSAWFSLFGRAAIITGFRLARLFPVSDEKLLVQATVTSPAKGQWTASVRFVSVDGRVRARINDIAGQPLPSATGQEARSSDWVRAHRRLTRRLLEGEDSLP